MKKITLFFRNRRNMIAAFIIFSIVTAAMVTGFLYLKIPKNAVIIGKKGYAEFIISKSNNTSVAQSFTVKYDRLTAVQVKIALKPVNYPTKSTLQFRLLDENGMTIRTVVLRCSDIHNYEYLNIPFDPVESSRGRQFTMKLNLNDIGNFETISFYTAAKTDALGIDGSQPDSELIFNNVYRGTRLQAIYNGRYKSGFVTFVLVCAVISILLLSFIIGYLIFLGDKKSDEK